MRQQGRQKNLLLQIGRANSAAAVLGSSAAEKQKERPQGLCQEFAVERRRGAKFIAAA